MTRRNGLKTSSSCQALEIPAKQLLDDVFLQLRDDRLTVADLLRRVADELSRVGIAEHQLEARLLLGNCLQMTRTQLFLRGDENPSAAERELLASWLKRRKQREPLAYIFGEQEFWSLSFKVSPAVLIPRPETEFLIDRVLTRCRRENLATGAMLDLCCGSGVIATVLAKETGGLVFASDLSSAALAVADENRKRHQGSGQVALLAGDLFAPFSPQPRFSLIVSNPPYVQRDDIATALEPEVAGYEPHLALDGGDDGLAIIARIRADVHRYLRPGGELFLEIGADQGQRVASMFSSPWQGAPRFSQVAVLIDYAGRDRVVHATLAK